MNMSARQKEKVNLYFRFLATTIGAGLITAFNYLTLLTNITVGFMFVFLMFLVGVLIGLYSTEIQYAIISGFLSIFFGFMILFGIVYLSVAVLNAWAILDVITLLTIDIVVRAFMLQLLGILPGVVIGQIIGPDWLEPSIKHKLKVGINGEKLSETT
jgi:hypothetical protein